MPANCETQWCGIDATAAQPGWDYASNSPVASGHVAGYQQAYANMGWVGFVKVLGLDTTDANKPYLLRLYSCDLKLSQAIETPEVIDGRIDRTVYKLGPKIVEGTVSLPLVADVDRSTLGDPGSSGCIDPSDVQGAGSAAGALVGNIWCWATSRNQYGRPSHDNVKLEVRYADHAAFDFDRALVSTFGLSVRAEEEIRLDLGLWARARTPGLTNPVADNALSGDHYLLSDFLSPARVFTWNDISVNAVTGCETDVGEAGVVLFSSSQVREFSMDINNNPERFYTLNGTLFPADINVRKREITGSLRLMGMSENLRMLAETNVQRFTEKNKLRVALYVGQDTSQNFEQAKDGFFENRDWLTDADVSNAIWKSEFGGTVFEIEEMELVNDLFESSLNWHALACDASEGNSGRSYEPFQPGTSCDYPLWHEAAGV